MGLITKEVEVLLHGNNIKWFENKGYKIPRREKKYIYKGKRTSKIYSVPRGTKIIVKVDDLQNGSHAEVNCECDECSKQLKMKWKTYYQSNHNGKIYCINCAHKVFNSGENSSRWNTNLTDEERKNGRNIEGYLEFINKVLARDNYTCVITGKTSSEAKLVVHHLDGYDWCVEGRTKVTNGITITEELHKSFHSKYGYGNNTKQQFLEFVKKLDIVLDDYNGEIPTNRWIYCITDNKIIKNVKQYAKENHYSRTEIYNCCNGKVPIYKYKIYIWYDIYKQMDKNEIEKYIIERKNNSRYKEVVCLNYKLIFSSAKCAGLYFGVDPSGITKCCKGKLQCFGKSINGENLIWKYSQEIEDIEEYVFVSDNDIQNKKLRCDYPCDIDYKKKIICITTKLCFPNKQEAANYYNICRTSINANLNGRSSYAGIHPITGEKLHWMNGSEYVEKYGFDGLEYVI